MIYLLLWVSGAMFTYGLATPENESSEGKILGMVMCLSSWPLWLGVEISQRLK